MLEDLYHFCLAPLSLLLYSFHDFSFLQVNYFIATKYILGVGNGNPLQYSCLANPMDRRTWWAAVHGVAKSRIRLSDFPFTFHFHALEKEMATHSSVLAWRIPGTGEPGGLLSMGSHRVGHDWSDLAAAAAAPPTWYSLSTSTAYSSAYLLPVNLQFKFSKSLNNC